MIGVKISDKVPPSKLIFHSKVMVVDENTMERQVFITTTLDGLFRPPFIPSKRSKADKKIEYEELYDEQMSRDMYTKDRIWIPMLEFLPNQDGEYWDLNMDMGKDSYAYELDKR